eukprot:gene5839-680_t
MGSSQRDAAWAKTARASSAVTTPLEDAPDRAGGRPRSGWRTPPIGLEDAPDRAGGRPRSGWRAPPIGLEGAPDWAGGCPRSVSARAGRLGPFLIRPPVRSPGPKRAAERPPRPVKPTRAAQSPGNT